jgi:Tfp pilus assembly PilM family ATPase
MDVLGIDIGTVSVKYIRWRGKKDKGIVISKNTYPYKGDLEDLHLILSQIKDMEGTIVDVVIGIISQEILKKTLTIPILPKEEVREALNWSTSKVISNPLEDMNYEYIMLGDVEERGIKKQEALFVGVQKSYVNKILSIFENTGFDRVRFFTDSGFVYVPLIEHEQDGSTAVIDIGGRQTGICIIQKNNLKFIRELMTASESFSDALMSGFNFSYNEAETYKIEKGFNDESLKILSVPFNRLIGETQRTFNVYNQRYPDQIIKKIYITGNGSRIPNILIRLKDAFNEEIAFLNAHPDVETEFLPSYVLCTNRESCVNLLPLEIKAKEKHITYKRWSRIATVGTLAVLFFFTMIIVHRFNDVSAALNSEKAIFAKINKEMNILGNVKSSMNYNELAAAARGAGIKDITFVLLMKYLSSHLPNYVYLKDVIFEIDKGPVYSKEVQKKDKQLEVEPPKNTAGETSKSSVRPPKGTDTSEQKSDSRQDYFVSIQGYIFGDEDVLEPALLDLIIKLNKTGFLINVEISKKEISETKGKGGKKIMEFALIARCSRYEV